MRRIIAALAAAILIPACADSGGGGAPTATQGLVSPSTPDAANPGGSEGPIVRIVSPGPRSTCRKGATINIHAVAVDPDAAILRVDFFDGAEPIGTRWSSPFIIAWGGISTGTHVLTAVALDVAGRTSVSAPVVVLVIDDDQHDHDDDDDDDDDHRHRRGRR
jgi:hypothetical protein